MQYIKFILLFSLFFCFTKAPFALKSTEVKLKFRIICNKGRNNTENCEILIKNPNKERNIPYRSVEKNQKIHPNRIQIWQFFLNHPNRLVIDFKNKNKFLIELNNKVLDKEIFTEQHFKIAQKNFGVRFIVNFNDEKDIEIKYNQEKNEDILIKIKNIRKNNLQNKKILLSNKVVIEQKNDNLKQQRNIRKNKVKYFKIAIDAGHGGSDPGTKGSKVLEKTITLQYAKNLKKKILEKQTDNIKFKVVLIRDQDKYIKIRKRVEIARENKVDIFISLHADSCPDKKTTGSTIYLIENIRHNHRDRKYFFLESYTPTEILKIKSHVIRNFFVDFLKNKLRNNSKILAKIISREFKKNFILNKIKEKEASFGVLRGLDISASLLIEIGYLTNQEEEKKMLSQNFMENFNEAIAIGITKFLYL